MLADGVFGLEHALRVRIDMLDQSIRRDRRGLRGSCRGEFGAHFHQQPLAAHQPEAVDPTAGVTMNEALSQER